MAQKEKNILEEEIEEINDDIVDNNLELNNTEEADFGEVFAAWQFPEFVKYQRNRLWYILFIIILAGLLIFAWFDRNITFAIVLVLIMIIYLNLERREALQFEIAITEDGILLNNKLIEYRNLSNFYIVYYPPHIKNLYLQPKNFLSRLIVVPLEDENPVIIRRALLQYIPEDLSKEHMPTSEGIARLIKF